MMDYFCKGIESQGLCLSMYICYTYMHVMNDVCKCVCISICLLKCPCMQTNFFVLFFLVFFVSSTLIALATGWKQSALNPIRNNMNGLGLLHPNVRLLELYDVGIIAHPT